MEVKILEAATKEDLEILINGFISNKDIIASDFNFAISCKKMAVLITYELIK